MKKRIGLYFLLVFSMNNLYSQGYQRLVETGNKWNYIIEIPTLLRASSDNNLTNSYFLTNDTIIDNTKYVKLMCSVIEYNKTETSYAGALREDTIKQRVYFLNRANKEILAYSFNDAVGDTIRVDSLPYNDGYVVTRVRSVDTVDFGGILRKRVEVYDVEYRNNLNPMPPFELFSDYWYEGIGSLNLLIDPDSHEHDRLLCFWHNDKQVYDNPEYDSCVYANYNPSDDINRINTHEGIILYPNPASGLLRVSCNEPITKIELLDMDGSVLRTTSTNELDASMLPDGIYFIRTTTESARILIERFIKRAR
jgi:Secretion system C-terminal sorting domain